jgi:hypothetical protein
LDVDLGGCAQFCAPAVGLGGAGDGLSGGWVVSGVGAVTTVSGGGGVGTAGAETTDKLAAGLLGCVEAVGGLAGDGAGTSGAATAALSTGELDAVVEFEDGV